MEALVWRRGINSTGFSSSSVGRAACSKAATRILPDRGRVRCHCPVCPAPLAERSEVHVRLDGNPVSARCKREGRRQRNTEGGCRHVRIGEGCVGAAWNNSSRETRSVRVEGDVKRGGRSRAIKIHASSVDLLDDPDVGGWDNEVISPLIVKGVVRSLKVLRNRCIGSGTIRLVIKDGSTRGRSR